MRGETMEKQRFEFDRLKILVLALLAVMVLLVSLVFLGRKEDRYQEFKSVSLDNKKAGETLQDEFSEADVILALHYPQFSDEPLNQLIKDHVAAIRAYQGEENDLVFLDYESVKSFDQDVTVRFFEKVYDVQMKLKQTGTSFITYDMKQQRTMKIEDIFRSDYLVQLQTMFNEIPEYYQIEEQGIRCFDKDGKELGLFEYASHERFIALKNPQVPSLAYKDRKSVV